MMDSVCGDDIVVVGSGAFGTALAAVAAASGKARVTLLTRREAVVEDFRETGRIDTALAGMDLPAMLAVSADPTVLEGAGIVLFAMPSQAQEEAARSLSALIRRDANVVICAKGLAGADGGLLSDLLEQTLHHTSVAVLSGPGFATDIAKGLPTAMVVATQDPDRAVLLAEALSGATFRLYPSVDRIGVQLGGALKNVLAIACGIVEGAGLGNSARAALIARGLAEMSRFVVARGGLAETVHGLSGLGDLVLTATSHQSRNLRYWIALAGLGQIAVGPGDLIEGAATASFAAKAALALSIDMPVTQAVAAIIDGRTDVKTALAQLMARPITQE